MYFEKKKEIFAFRDQKIKFNQEWSYCHPLKSLLYIYYLSHDYKHIKE